MLLVDTNVLLDVLEDDPAWADWSLHQLRAQSQVHELAINPVIYAELASSFASQAKLEQCIDDLELGFRDMSRQALFLAGVAHRHYRRAGGPRLSILADFLIGAHAAVLGCGILTRDERRYRHYFPRVPLVTP